MKFWIMIFWTQKSKKRKYCYPFLAYVPFLCKKIGGGFLLFHQTLIKESTLTRINVSFSKDMMSIVGKLNRLNWTKLFLDSIWIMKAAVFILMRRKLQFLVIISLKAWSENQMKSLQASIICATIIYLIIS